MGRLHLSCGITVKANLGGVALERHLWSWSDFGAPLWPIFLRFWSTTARCNQVMKLTYHPTQ